MTGQRNIQLRYSRTMKRPRVRTKRRVSVTRVSILVVGLLTALALIAATLFPFAVKGLE